MNTSFQNAEEFLKLKTENLELNSKQWRHVFTDKVTLPFIPFILTQ